MSLYINVYTTNFKILILSTIQQKAFVRSETQIATVCVSRIALFFYNRDAVRLL